MVSVSGRVSKPRSKSSRPSIFGVGIWPTCIARYKLGVARYGVLEDPGRREPSRSLNPARTLPSTFTFHVPGYSTMLLLRDPSPRIAQDSQILFTPSHTPNPQCKDEPSTPHSLVLSPFQNPINSLPASDTAPVKVELEVQVEDDSKMERQNEAGGSQSRPNDQSVYTC